MSHVFTGPGLPGACARPLAPVNGRFVQPARDSYSVGERVEFVCNDNYVAQPVASLVLICGLNGFTPSQVAQCVLNPIG